MPSHSVYTKLIPLFLPLPYPAFSSLLSQPSLFVSHALPVPSYLCLSLTCVSALPVSNFSTSPFLSQQSTSYICLSCPVLYMPSPLPLFLLFLCPLFHFTSSLAVVLFPRRMPFLSPPIHAFPFTFVSPLPLPSIPLHLFSSCCPSPRPLPFLSLHMCLPLPSTLNTYLHLFPSTTQFSSFLLFSQPSSYPFLHTFSRLQ